MRSLLRIFLIFFLSCVEVGHCHRDSLFLASPSSFIFRGFEGSLLAPPSYQREIPPTPFGHFETSRTLQKMLDSLGRFPKGVEVITLKEPKTAGYIPFELSDDGKVFFSELFSQPFEELDTQAYLLTHQDEKEVLPYALLIRNSKTKKCFAFYLTGVLFQDAKNLHFGSGTVQELASSSAANLVGGSIEDQTTLERWRVNIPGIDLEMLTIKHKNIFPPWSQDSQEFQRAIYDLGQKGMLQNKRLMEIGVGTGVNVLLALKLGASSVVGTDISRLYTLLTRWNVQFAQDTGDIRELPPDAVLIIPEAGFANAPAADLYFFNCPVIFSAEELKKHAHKFTTLWNKAYFILTRNFSDLFEELKQRLRQPGSKALWRIMPLKGSGLVDVTEEPLASELKELHSKTYWMDLAKAQISFIARAFLRKMKCAFQSPVKDVYLISMERTLIPTRSERNPLLECSL